MNTHEKCQNCTCDSPKKCKNVIELDAIKEFANKISHFVADHSKKHVNVFEVLCFISDEINKSEKLIIKK